MSTDNWVKYAHDTFNYRDERKNYCNRGQKDKYDYSLDTKTRSGEETEKLQSVAPLQSLDINPKTIKVHNGSEYETDCTINIATNVEPPNLAEDQRIIQEDTILKTQNLAADGITNTFEVCLDNDKQAKEDSPNPNLLLMPKSSELNVLQEHTILKMQNLATDDIANTSDVCLDDDNQAREDSQNPDLSLMPKSSEHTALQEDTILKTQNLATDDITNTSEVCLNDDKQTEEGIPNPDLPLMPKSSEHTALSVPSEKNHAANQFADSSNIKSYDHSGGCGLLRYRKWWDQTEVDISICGKLITGIPIFIEDNTLRVVNSNYSYFIPLEKVDFIRTTDGLRPCSNSSAGKPVE